MQLFVNVNEQGEITTSYFGKNIIATEAFDFFFLVDEEIVDNIDNYQVSLDGFKPSLVLKD